MTTRWVAVAARLRDVAPLLARQGMRWLYRRLRGRPTEGPQLLRETLERLSGAFIKFGQILSLQIDTLPRAYCDELLELLDRVAPFPAAAVDQVFRDDLHASPRELFGRFDYPTIASASIGQVHKAVLKDGTAVAVKVQRPGIRTKFETDNLLLQALVKLIFFFRAQRLYFMRDPVRELATWTQDELNYRREATHCQLLAENAVHRPSERVPRIFWELTTPRILTMEFLDGPSVSEYLRMVEEKDETKLAALRERGFVPEVFSARVISNFLSDAFRFGVFHADLHPANLLILPGNVVGYVDFGIVAVLTSEARRKQIELTLAYSSGDAEAIYQGFLNISTPGEDADLPGMRRRINALVAEWYHEPAIAGRVRFRVSVTRTMMDLLAVCRDFGFLIDREMVKYVRSTILADGLVSRLAPGFDLARELRRVVEQYLAEEGQRKVLSSAGVLSMLTDLTLWIEAGPGALLHALSSFERRQLRLRVQRDTRPDRARVLRVRTVGAAVVWAVVFIFTIGGAGLPSWRGSPGFAILTAIFLALWFAWLLRLLQRLSVKG